ncbi:DUF4238 domain-containing protein [Rheinheimera soli]|uniref:Uncharacterized protein YchJ n=1 Tax=Rheinheimera soli TaxID=443616 RepID=A0ABU1W146_9GAMM|nr:DUF4238 domain-containing protein [Rheinheimera soli]MDR7121677.1 uncharacterized protein YchJ [Rheinheimera soli]
MATKDNHYVPQWYQKGFVSERDNQLCHLIKKEIRLPTGEMKTIQSQKWYTPAQQFYKEHLYSTFFGALVNDEIEQKLFGPIDDNGSLAVRAFMSDDQALWHHSFKAFFTYIDAQKLRTPKGLDWIRSKYPELSQVKLMIEMQALRTMHCTMWSEGVRELISAEDSEVKFIVSDHPVTIYNYACPPDSEFCAYPNDPDIALKGSQTIFPLDKNRCLILTNLEYAREPENANPLEQRTHATRIRQSMVMTIEFINSRKLKADDVTKINYIIKSRAKESVAAGNIDWLYPEKDVKCDWAELRHVLLPPRAGVHFGGEMYAHFEDGTVHYQDAFGRTTPPSDYLNKDIDETRLGRNDKCGCGSGKKYKVCCQNVPLKLRATWKVLSIRERQLAFCKCIRDVLGLDSGNTWVDVRRKLASDQIKQIYEFYAVLWPRETDIYSLMPKSDGKFRGLYTGLLDARTIGNNALPMASMFDEYLIETPVTNPNIIRPEFSPIENPAKFKYQALKEFMFMLALEPYIGLGFVNLIPDPSEFDLPLMRAMMEMASARGDSRDLITEQDRRLHFKLSIEDLLNSTALLPRQARIQLLIDEFGMVEDGANQLVDELDRAAESSPLTLLQQAELRDGGQFIISKLGPNYEMSLLIAQATGSVLVTDSSSRWQEFLSSQRIIKGGPFGPWHDVNSQLTLLPIDELFLDKFQKSQGFFAIARHLLKATDKFVLDNNRNSKHLTMIASQASDFKKQLEQVSKTLQLARLRIVSPEGGFSDANVQRLLARSSCLEYDKYVRSLYAIGLKD